MVLRNAMSVSRSGCDYRKRANLPLLAQGALRSNKVGGTADPASQILGSSPVYGDESAGDVGRESCQPKAAGVRSQRVGDRHIKLSTHPREQLLPHLTLLLVLSLARCPLTLKLRTISATPKMIA
jgi:hypothetical protein